MIFISSRRNFTDPDNFNDSGHKIRNYGSSDAWSEMTMQELGQAVSHKKVLLLVHGYNNVFEDVKENYSLIERKTNIFASGMFDVVLGYLWPGGDHAWEYKPAKGRANVAGARFIDILRLFSNSGVSLTVETHSLGSRVALKAVDISGIPVELLLTAAAIDNESLEDGEEFSRAAKKSSSTFVFHSMRDDVLNVPYRLSEGDTALGFSGPENPDKTPDTVKVVNCKYKIFKHGDYKSCDDFYKFIAIRNSMTKKFETL